MKITTGQLLRGKVLEDAFAFYPKTKKVEIINKGIVNKVDLLEDINKAIEDDSVLRYSSRQKDGVIYDSSEIIDIVKDPLEWTKSFLVTYHQKGIMYKIKKVEIE